MSVGNHSKHTPTDLQLHFVLLQVFLGGTIILNSLLVSLSQDPRIAKAVIDEKVKILLSVQRK